MNGKVVTMERLLENVSTAKTSGLTVVLAGGCFDVFHIGHLEYLEGAKLLGDILIIGLNSDESIQRIKHRKPLFSTKERAELLTAFACVDYLFIFEEDTLDHSIRQIAPDLFAKGIDYIDKNVLEVTTVEEAGGRVVFIGDLKKSSSTYISKEIFRRYKENHEKAKEYFGM